MHHFAARLDQLGREVQVAEQHAYLARRSIERGLREDAAHEVLLESLAFCSSVSRYVHGALVADAQVEERDGPLRVVLVRHEAGPDVEAAALALVPVAVGKDVQRLGAAVLDEVRVPVSAG